MHVRSVTPRPASYSHLAGPPAVQPSAGIAESGTLNGRRVLLATDGSAESRAACAIASLLARRRGARPAAIRAFGYVAPWDSSHPAPVADMASGVEPMELSRHLVQVQLARDVGGAADWPVHVAVGHAARAIEAATESTHAALVVMGLCGASADGTPADHKTVLHVMKQVDVPVLATNGALADLPRRIVVGVDLRESGLRAARAALSLVDDGGTLVLTFVRPGGPVDDDSASGDVGVGEAFERLQRMLAAPRSLRVATAVLDGSVPSALADFARRTHAGLIALGARQQHFADRRVLGGVTSGLVRDATRSLLVVPPSARVV
ncbi:MAG: universal stress protein [bacterium]